MKKFLLVFVSTLFVTSAMAQSPGQLRHQQMQSQGGQGQQSTIPCDTLADCQLRTQYESDLIPLLADQAKVQADIQAYAIPAQQAKLNAQQTALQTQLTTDQATISSMQTAGVTTVTALKSANTSTNTTSNSIAP